MFPEVIHQNSAVMILKKQLLFMFLASLCLWLLMACMNSHKTFRIDSDFLNNKSHSVDSREHSFLHVIHEKDNFSVNTGRNRSERNPDFKKKKVSDRCLGRYIFVHNLPPRFNSDMLKSCESLSVWYNVCRALLNSGLGSTIVDSQEIFSGFFSTDQFSLDVIFHNRMSQYKCLTSNSSLASAIYVPFYAGLEIGRHLWGFNSSIRDAASLDLVKWLTSQPEWKAMDGMDHFLVAGRIAWDFKRTDGDTDWGSILLTLPESKNMTFLVIESSPWSMNDVAIPYPTYFHPSRNDQILQWQNSVRNQRRRYLFSFAGATRKVMGNSIREEVMKQCRSPQCFLLRCSSSVSSKCKNPLKVMGMFMDSVFCLQPPGDSLTRRSVFDSLLAGCIPVFFHPGSAYIQYLWHLPKNYSKYSVFIPEEEVKYGRVRIAKALGGIEKDVVAAMREEVIRLIPRIVYADPRGKLEFVEDAFDVAIKGVLERVDALRRERIEGRESTLVVAEGNSWKYNLLGSIKDPHVWDPFFTKIKRG